MECDYEEQNEDYGTDYDWACGEDGVDYDLEDGYEQELEDPEDDEDGDVYDEWDGVLPLFDYDDYNIFDMMPSRVPTPPPPTPTKPPPPIALGHFDSLVGKGNMQWNFVRRNSADRYDLISAQTGLPCLVSFYTQIKGNNFAVTQGVTKDKEGDLMGEKIYCYGTQIPIPGFDGYWGRVRGQLRQLLDDFAHQHPHRVADISQHDNYLLTSIQNGIKIQQPLLLSDIWMYGLSDDPFYAHEVRRLPEDFQHMCVYPDRPGEQGKELDINPLLAVDDDGNYLHPGDYSQLHNACVEIRGAMHYIPRRRGGIFVLRPLLFRPVSGQELYGECERIAASQSASRGRDDGKRMRYPTEDEDRCSASISKEKEKRKRHESDEELEEGIGGSRGHSYASEEEEESPRKKNRRG